MPDILDRFPGDQLAMRLSRSRQRPHSPRPTARHGVLFCASFVRVRPASPAHVGPFEWRNGLVHQRSKCCREAGVDTSLSPSRRVIVEKGRAVGVAAGGKAWSAPQIVANVNPKLLFDRLVPQGAVSRDVQQHFNHWGCESATFRMNVALDKLPSFTARPGRGDHLTAGIIIGPSMDYMHRAYADAALNGWTKAPVVEMLIPSTLDPTLAPKGKHVASLFCQHFRYKLPDGRQWDGEREVAADAIIATVETHAPGFAASVIARQIHSPLDLERRFGLIGGDIFHGKMGNEQLFSARPMIGHRLPNAAARPIPVGIGRNPGAASQVRRA